MDMTDVHRQPPSSVPKGYDSDFGFDAFPLAVSCTDRSDIMVLPDDMVPDRRLMLCLMDVVHMACVTGSPVHAVTRTSDGWIHGVADPDGSFSGLLFPRGSDPVQADDACLREMFRRTMRTGVSQRHTFSVSGYSETPWFGDAVGYIMMYDRRGRYVMTDRDPHDVWSDGMVISGPTELFSVMNDKQRSVGHRVGILDTGGCIP